VVRNEDFFFKNIKYDLHWDVNGDGVPTETVHFQVHLYFICTHLLLLFANTTCIDNYYDDDFAYYYLLLLFQICLPGGFCTPWQYLATNAINCVPIQHLNHHSDSGDDSKHTLAVPVMYFLDPHDEQGLHNGGFGVVSFRCRACDTVCASSSLDAGAQSTDPCSVEYQTAAGLRPFMAEHFIFLGTDEEMHPMEETGSSRLIITSVLPGLGPYRWQYEKVAECDRSLQNFGHRNDGIFYTP
jgi:hypothetical protein